MTFTKLILLRHGQSLWNLENKFTGWTDVDLSEKGVKEAIDAGSLLKKHGFKLDLIMTSMLKRASRTMDLCLNEMNQSNKNIIYDWRLNERHYGALQGLNKLETSAKFGEEQVFIWRRSYDTPPPSLSISDNRHPANDIKYQKIKELLPNSESLKDTYNRLLPLIEQKIIKNIKQKQRLLIVAHGNSLRAIVKYLKKISDTEIVNLNIPTGQPLVFELNDQLCVKNDYFLKDLKEQ